jgi:hypothetical protein
MNTKLTAIAVGALVLAATAISPALGGPSLSQMVKDEVAKLAKKTKKKKRGPRGPVGPAGPQGSPGTARAYALVSASTAPTAASAFFTKGISSPVAHPSTGVYCVAAPGLDPTNTPAVVSAETAGTSSPEGNTTAQPFVGASGCPGDTFPVATFRLPTTAPVTGALSDSVAFTIMIP